MELDDEPPLQMCMSAESPKRPLRHYHGDEATYLVVVVGDHHATGHGEDLEQHYRALIAFAQEHFAVRSVAYRWSAQDFIPVDGVPYVGRLPCSERMQVASGFKKWGLPNGPVDARIMTDGIVGRDNVGAEAFDVKRLGALRDYAKLARDNSRVAARFVGDRLTLPGPSASEQLEAGDGVVVRSGTKPVAVSRAADGELHTVSAVCTHLGCVVDSNDAQTRWDCPCHGSRSATDGAVVTGPATRPLHDAELPDQN